MLDGRRQRSKVVAESCVQDERVAGLIGLQVLEYMGCVGSGQTCEWIYMRVDS